MSGKTEKERLSKGLCRYCGKEPHLPNQQRCQNCADYIYQYRHRGFCGDCKKPGVSGQYCHDCKRKRHLKSIYGITVEDYDNLLAKQNGCCAICGTNDSGHRTKYLFVDHDHITGEVRGLLCKKCNSAIGLLDDREDLLEKALAYVRGHNEKPAEDG